MSGRVKVFVIYHREGTLYRSNCFEPIQTGCKFAAVNLGILRDDDGVDEISGKNKNYGELSGNYWVWKNYLPQHPEVEYVGFAHMRRFLDFSRPARGDGGQFDRHCEFSDFVEGFENRYSERMLLSAIRDNDIILPGKCCSGVSQFDAYRVGGHPMDDLKMAMQIVRTDFADYVEDMDAYFAGNTAYYCLNYVMRRELFERFMTWLFAILNKLEQMSDWSQYNDYATIRAPAYIAERFLNIWVEHERRTHGLKVAEYSGILLVPDGSMHWYDRFSPAIALLRTAFFSIFDGSFATRLHRHWRCRFCKGS